MSNLIKSDQSNGLTIWSDQSGKAYLVRQQPNGETVFTPLESALSNLQQTQSPAHQHDPLAILGICICAVLGIAIGGYFLGFIAGNHGRETVIIPRSPICRTQESSFLFWNSRREDCK